MRVLANVPRKDALMRNGFGIDIEGISDVVYIGDSVISLYDGFFRGFEA